MSAKRLHTQQGTRADAMARLRDAAAYLDVAELAAGQDGAVRATCIGNAVLAGIAAGDAICYSALGERYAGNDHMADADLLERVSKSDATLLRRLIALKTPAHYGGGLLRSTDETRALRAASALVSAAKSRLAGGV